MKQKKFVVLVEISKFLSCLHWPKVGDYDNKYIKHIIPCVLEDGVYRRFENGQPVEKTAEMFEWNLSHGVMFHLKDRDVLITRDFQGRTFLTDKVKFNPMSMVRYEAK